MLIVLGKSDIRPRKLCCSKLFPICEFCFCIGEFSYPQKPGPSNLESGMDVKVLEGFGFALSNSL